MRTARSTAASMKTSTEKHDGLGRDQKCLRGKRGEPEKPRRALRRLLRRAAQARVAGGLAATEEPAGAGDGKAGGDRARGAQAAGTDRDLPRRGKGDRPQGDQGRDRGAQGAAGPGRRAGGERRADAHGALRRRDGGDEQKKKKKTSWSCGCPSRARSRSSFCGTGTNTSATAGRGAAARAGPCGSRPCCCVCATRGSR